MTEQGNIINLKEWREFHDQMYEVLEQADRVVRVQRASIAAPLHVRIAALDDAIDRLHDAMAQWR